MGSHQNHVALEGVQEKFTKISKMSTEWQRNLRRSDVAGQIGAKSKNDGIAKKVSAMPAAQYKNPRRSDGVAQMNRNGSKAMKPRLKSVTEFGNDDVFGDEKIEIVPRANRKRLSTQGSVSEYDNASQKPSKEVEEQKPPIKVTKACSFLRPIRPFNLPGDDSEVKNIPSPIPLPKGVVNIDPHDDSSQIYGRDIFNYVVGRDAKFVVTSKDISSEADPKIEDRREHLVDWLMSVAHHCKTSQETFYHTVDILDRCLSKVNFKTEHLQLLGVTSFLIATKIDEYHPANINDLCRLTEDSATPVKVLAMEHKILETINFETYGTEPMTFIRRFLKAAQLSSDEKTSVYELSILFMDAMVLKLWENAQDACTPKKAAVAVFTALLLTKLDTCTFNVVEKIWTPNMVHYVWKDYRDLIPMSKCMLKILNTILEDSKNEFALTAKYKSVSRHAGLLQKLDQDWVIDVELFIKTL